MCPFQQQQVTVDEDNQEESPDVSDAASDESDSEDSDNAEQRQTTAEEKQETGIKSRDVNMETAGRNNEGDDDSSASLTGKRSVEEIETVTIGASSESHLFVDQGIFSGSRTHQVKRAGPMITEIVMDKGNNS